MGVPKIVNDVQPRKIMSSVNLLPNTNKISSLLEKADMFCIAWKDNRSHEKYVPDI
jgi:hypothetical protein